MASLVRPFLHPAAERILTSRRFFDLLSPSSTVSVTRRPSTTRSDPASADVTKFLEVRRRSSGEEQIYSCTYHTPVGMDPLHSRRC